MLQRIAESKDGDLYASRDFYGALYIRYLDTAQTKPVKQVLMSGDSDHGMQIMTAADRRRPTTYFAETVLGDARLSMEREQPQNFDVLILDAFSGVAIPSICSPSRRSRSTSSTSSPTACWRCTSRTGIWIFGQCCSPWGNWPV